MNRKWIITIALFLLTLVLCVVFLIVPKLNVQPTPQQNTEVTETQISQYTFSEDGKYLFIYMKFAHADYILRLKINGTTIHQDETHSFDNTYDTRETLDYTTIIIRLQWIPQNTYQVFMNIVNNFSDLNRNLTVNCIAPSVKP